MEVFGVLTVTTENIEGYKVVEVKGTVFGLIVRSRARRGYYGEFEGFSGR